MYRSVDTYERRNQQDKDPDACMYVVALAFFALLVSVLLSVALPTFWQVDDGALIGHAPRPKYVCVAQCVEPTGSVSLAKSLAASGELMVGHALRPTARWCTRRWMQVQMQMR